MRRSRSRYHFPVMGEDRWRMSYSQRMPWDEKRKGQPLRKPFVEKLKRSPEPRTSGSGSGKLGEEHANQSRAEIKN